MRKPKFACRYREYCRPEEPNGPDCPHAIPHQFNRTCLNNCWLEPKEVPTLPRHVLLRGIVEGRLRKEDSFYYEIIKTCDEIQEE